VTVPGVTTLDSRRAALIGLVLLAALKLALLAVSGPLEAPDSNGYRAIAEHIAATPDWWRQLDFGAADAALLSGRMMGYPVLLALATWVVGPAAAGWAVCLVQAAAGLVSVVLLYRFTAVLLGRPSFALVLAGVYATSLPLTYDQALLSDGLYASLFVAFVSVLGRWAVLARRVPPGRLAAVGLLPAAALLLRESAVYGLLLLLPFVAVVAWRVRDGWAARGVAVLLVCLPLFATQAAYGAWNAWRAGVSFMTSGLRTALMPPLVNMAAAGTPVFDAPEPLAAALAAELPRFENAAIYGAVAAAERRFGLTPVAMATEVRGLFFRSVARHPGAYLRYVVGELHPRYATLAVAPVASVGLIVASADRPLVAVSALVPAGGAARWAMLAGLGLSAALGGLCWLALVIGMPALLRSRPPGFGLMAGLWLYHLGLLGLFALVHIEARYLISAQMAPLLAAALLVARARRR